KAKRYLEEIRKGRRRDMRDQLQLIMKHAKLQEQIVLDRALEECRSRQLFSATDFVDMVHHLNRQRLERLTDEKKRESGLQPSQYWSEATVQAEAQTRDINEHDSVLEGDVR